MLLAVLRRRRRSRKIRPERTRLYTKPDPANPGGLKGRIAKPELPIEQILALPAGQSRGGLRGEVTGPKRDTFHSRVCRSANTI